jgi:GAF domain-containing protein
VPASGYPSVADVAAARRLLPEGGNPGLDRLVGLATRLLGVRSGQVSVLTDVQTVAAGAGLEPGAVGGTGPLADSLCTVTALSGGPLAVGRAVADPRVAGLSPVTSGAVGSYLGVPLADSRGHTIGVLCVFDPGPRDW